MGSVENARSKRGKILSIRAEDYGIFIYEALATSSRMLTQAKASNRHIILFADAAHSIEPGDYRNLLAKCASANITVSTIGLGAKTDVDAQLLIDIAKRGGGESYFTADPNEIPRLFAQDTFTATRSAFVEDATKAALLAPYASLGGTLRTDMPALGGYNLCYLKPEASLATVSQDENAAPIVASWHRGNGRVLCYTGEADGAFTGAMAAWPAIGEFFSTLTRWTAGYADALPASMMAVSELRDGLYRVELHLDPARTKDPFDVLPDVRVLRGIPGQLPSDEIHPLLWATADMLAADIPLAGAETVIAAVSVPGLAPAMLAPVCLPYSPEFQPPEQGKGRETLERLAAATGGKSCADMADVWRSLPRTPRRADLSLWLYLTAVLLLVLEVLERRTGWITRASALVGVSLRRLWNIVSGAIARWRRSIRITPHTTAVPAAKAKDVAKPAAEPESSDATTVQASPDAGRDTAHEAMQRARDRARRLTRK